MYMSYFTVVLMIITLPLALGFAALTNHHIWNTYWWQGRRLSDKPWQSSNSRLTLILSLESEHEGRESDDDVPYQSVGLRENHYFDLDASVYDWQDFMSMGNEGNVQQILNILRQQTLKSSSSSLCRAYWGSQLLRSGYFTVNAMLGTIASDIWERWQNPSLMTNALQNEKESMNPILDNRQRGKILLKLIQSDIPTRLLLEVCKTLEQEYKWIENGILKYPWDAVLKYDNENTRMNVQLKHPQINPLYLFSETQKAVTESVAIFSRRNRGISQVIPTTAPTTTLPRQGLPSTTTNIAYPDYYLYDFHYQTDGWMSNRSAERYEVSTETLFLGRQDAMQRQTLIPLLEWLQLSRRSPSLSEATKTTTDEDEPRMRSISTRHSTEPRALKVLEIACGTGRFTTYLRDNLPHGTEVTISDLSPYYLKKAKENDDLWRRIVTNGSTATTSTSSGNDNHIPLPVTCIQANAEELPFLDHSFDAVVCIYLFHELPPVAQRRVASEMIRVCRSGGILIVSDSLQYGDRRHTTTKLTDFAQLHEPHYEHYVESTYFPDLFRGAKCHTKYVSSSTKTLSFLKE